MTGYTTTKTNSKKVVVRASINDVINNWPVIIA